MSKTLKTGLDDLVLESSLKDAKVVNCFAVYVRSTPSTDSKDNIIDKLPEGSLVTVDMSYLHNKFTKILYAGSEAYVVSEYLQLLK